MKSNDKTLVVLTPAFAKTESETYWVPFVQLMITSLQRSYPGLNVVVLSFVYPYEESSYTWHGLRVISFDGMHKRKLKRIGLWRKVWKELKGIRRQHNIIGLFSVWAGECAFIGKWFGKRYSIRHCSWICGQDALKTNKWISFIRPKENQLAAMSHFLVSEFNKNHGIQPRYIVQNSIDPSLFSPSLPEKDIDILGVGSLIALKQYDLFVKAVAALRNSIPAIRAFHCGLGDEKEKIEVLIKKLGLENNLQLLGGKTLAEVLQLMQRTRVFLHTSRYEGFGIVCLEALYAGAHVISFCYPLDHSVAHWHVVKTVEEMITKALVLLTAPNTEYSSVLVHTMDESAKELMKIFKSDSDSGVKPR